MKTKIQLLAALLFASPLVCLAETQAPVNPVVPSCPQTWISFMPVIFFTIILVFTIIKLRKDKVSLSDLLAEKDVAPPAAAAAGAPAPPPTPTDPPQSVSRFIAFISGLTTISIAVCLVTFYMYEYFAFNGNKTIDLSTLSNVLLALGLGVVPYGVNKISAAIK